MQSGRSEMSYQKKVGSGVAASMSHPVRIFRKQIAYFDPVQHENIDLVTIFRGEITIGGMIGQVFYRHQKRSFLFDIVTLIHDCPDDHIVIRMIDAADNILAGQIDADYFRKIHLLHHEKRVIPGS